MSVASLDEYFLKCSSQLLSFQKKFSSCEKYTKLANGNIAFGFNFDIAIIFSINVQLKERGMLYRPGFQPSWHS